MDLLFTKRLVQGGQCRSIARQKDQSTNGSVDTIDQFDPIVGKRPTDPAQQIGVTARIGLRRHTGRLACHNDLVIGEYQGRHSMAFSIARRHSGTTSSGRQ